MPCDRHPATIVLVDCRPRHVYRLVARNLRVGVFDGEGRFLGLADFFGRQHLDDEDHWDVGAPFGTACPVEDLGPLPGEVPLHVEEGPNRALFATLRALEASLAKT